MPATKAKPAKAAKPAAKPSTRAAKSKAAATPVATKPAKRKPAKPVVVEEPVIVMSDRSAAISAAMLELAEVRTAARAKRGGTPAKHLIFNEWFKALLAGKAFDLTKAAKQFPEVKATTIKAWRNKWRNGRLPSNGRGKEQQIAKAIKQGAVA